MIVPQHIRHRVEALAPVVADSQCGGRLDLCCRDADLFGAEFAGPRELDHVGSPIIERAVAFDQAFALEPAERTGQRGSWQAELVAQCCLSLAAACRPQHAQQNDAQTHPSFEMPGSRPASMRRTAWYDT